MLKLLKFFLFGFVVPIHFSVDANPSEVKYAEESNQQIIEIAREIELLLGQGGAITVPANIKSFFSAPNLRNIYDFDAQKLLDDPNLIKTFIKFFLWGNQESKYPSSSKILAYWLNKLHDNSWPDEAKIRYQRKILEAFCSHDIGDKKSFPFTKPLMDEVAHFECNAVLPFLKNIAKDASARRVVWDMALTSDNAEFQKTLLDAVSEKRTSAKWYSGYSGGYSFEGMNAEILFDDDRFNKLISAGFFTVFIDLFLNSNNETYLKYFFKHLKTFFNKIRLNAERHREFHRKSLRSILEKGKALNLISEKDYEKHKSLLNTNEANALEKCEKYLQRNDAYKNRTVEEKMISEYNGVIQGINMSAAAYDAVHGPEYFIAREFSLLPYKRYSQKNFFLNDFKSNPMNLLSDPGKTLSQKLQKNLMIDFLWPYLKNETQQKGLLRLMFGQSLNDQLRELKPDFQIGCFNRDEDIPNKTKHEVSIIELLCWTADLAQKRVKYLRQNILEGLFQTSQDIDDVVQGGNTLFKDIICVGAFDFSEYKLNNQNFDIDKLKEDLINGSVKLKSYDKMTRAAAGKTFRLLEKACNAAVSQDPVLTGYFDMFGAVVSDGNAKNRYRCSDGCYFDLRRSFMTLLSASEDKKAEHVDLKNVRFPGECENV